MKPLIRKQSLMIVIFLLLIPVALQAQEKPKKNPKKAAQSPTSGITQQAKKLFLNKIEIKGWIEKPQMVYIIPGVDPKVDDIVIDRSFIDEIMKPLDKDTFERKFNKKQKMLIPW